MKYGYMCELRSRSISVGVRFEYIEEKYLRITERNKVKWLTKIVRNNESKKERKK